MHRLHSGASPGECQGARGEPGVGECVNKAWRVDSTTRSAIWLVVLTPALVQGEYLRSRPISRTIVNLIGSAHPKPRPRGVLGNWTEAQFENRPIRAIFPLDGKRSVRDAVRFGIWLEMRRVTERALCCNLALDFACYRTGRLDKCNESHLPLNEAKMERVVSTVRSVPFGLTRDGPGFPPGLAQPSGPRGRNIGRSSSPLGLCRPSPRYVSASSQKKPLTTRPQRCPATPGVNTQR